MPTIQSRTRNGATHNLTSFDTAEAAEDALFNWQFACNRLLQISDNAVPNEFWLIPNQNGITGTLQNSLNAQVQARTAAQTAVPVALAAIVNQPACQFISTLGRDDMSRATTLGRSFLLLDAQLLLALRKAGGQPNAAGNALLTALEKTALSNNLQLDDTTLTIAFIERMYDANDKEVTSHARRHQQNKERVHYLEAEVKNCKHAVEAKKQHLHDEESIGLYVSPHEPFSAQNIELLEKSRIWKFASFSVWTRSKLDLVLAFGRPTDHFFGDDLPALKARLRDHLAAARKDQQSRLAGMHAEVNELTTSYAAAQGALTHARQEQQTHLSNSVDVLTPHNIDTSYARDVGRVCASTNAVLLHAINNSGFAPLTNSPLARPVSFKDKVNQIRSFDTALSCSSFTVGEGHRIDEFASTFGVILNAGSIEAATRGDDGTQVNTLGQRVPLAGNKGYSRLSGTALHEVIAQRGVLGNPSYNEIVVARTGVASLYINMDRLGADNAKASSAQRVLDTVFAYNREHPEHPLPVCIIHGGAVCRIEPRLGKNMSSTGLEYNSISALLEDQYTISTPLRVADILALKNELDASEKLAMAQTLVGNYKPQYQVMLHEQIKALQAGVATSKTIAVEMPQQASSDADFAIEDIVLDTRQQVFNDLFGHAGAASVPEQSELAVVDTGAPSI